MILSMIRAGGRVDISITKKRKFNTKRYALLFLAVLLVFFALRHLWFIGQADFSVKANTLVFGEVKRGRFTVSVRGTGVLVPDHIQWLSANVEATVERLAVKAGNLVKKGDLIVALKNPQLVQRLDEAKWELEAMAAELIASEVTQESALLEQKARVLNAKLGYESSLLTYNAQKTLLKTSAVSKLDYERTVLEIDQFKQRWKISKEQFEKMQDNLIAQNNARKARLNKTKKSVERIQQQVNELNVLATMDAIVLEMPLEIGQRVSMGANIAKLAQQNSLIAELQVPEIQIRDVVAGLRVIVDTRNNTIEGRVLRVDPAVVSGNVQVDVVFEKPLPSDARPDLSVDGVINIAEIIDTLYVERPLFSQSNSHLSFYKLSQGGAFAEKVVVEVGFGSVSQIQIINGLSVGDKIITSNPTRFETYEKIRIN